MRVSGGYLMSNQPLVRGDIHSHSAALKRPASEAAILALNRLQGVEMRINRFTLEVAETAWAADTRLPGIEKAMRRFPSSFADYATWKAHLVGGRKVFSDEVWSAMSKGDRKDHLRMMGEVHAHNSRVDGREWGLMSLLTVADMLRDVPSIWYPHSRCFRGRLHPMVTSGPNPQGNDMAKSMLMFAAGLPLGDDGLYWLLVRAANHAGHDKLALDQRVAWSLDHRDQIIAAAADPLHSGWWSACKDGGDPIMDDPWQFLATCHELSLAWRLSDPREFVSHLPVAIDGTCNGLQHLFAMGLSENGAASVNLTEHPVRQDIYEEVKIAACALVERDAANGVAEAHQWLGKVTRKTVKRAVMTTPYGVSDRGIRTQLIKDGFVEEFDKGSQGAAADYLRDKVTEALDVKIGDARAIMAWLQTVASRLASAGLPFCWATPDGSTVQQAYHTLSGTRVRTIVGSPIIWRENDKAAVNVRKQSSGAAPNFIHSFDAAHLTLTINAAWDEGIRSLVTVHDSYATHARNTRQLGRVLRETFVHIYSEDWIGKTREAILADPDSAHVDLPPAPARGTFDISRTLYAPFLFS